MSEQQEIAGASVHIEPRYTQLEIFGIKLNAPCPNCSRSCTRTTQDWWEVKLTELFEACLECTACKIEFDVDLKFTLACSVVGVSEGQPL